MNKLLALGALAGLLSAGCASTDKGADPDTQINASYGIGRGTITTTNSPASTSNSTSSDTSSAATRNP